MDINRNLSQPDPEYRLKMERGIKYFEFDRDTDIREKSLVTNCLFLVMEGNVAVGADSFGRRPVAAGSMLLLTEASDVSIRAQRGARVLCLEFHLPGSGYDRMVMQSLSEYCREHEYRFEPTPVKSPMHPFVELALYCLEGDISCAHMYDAMQHALLFILREFYTRQEIAMLLHPLICGDTDFRGFVLENWPKVGNIGKLAVMANMSRSTFYRKFLASFGMTAKEWAKEQLDKKIVEQIKLTPNVTVQTLADLFDFSSGSAFSRYININFHCTAREFIRSCTEKKAEKVPEYRPGHKIYTI